MTDCRTATLSELEQVLDWAAAEGWNPGLEDAVAFHAADPDGFFVATSDGTPIAAISVVNHNDNFAFLGLYIVRPAYRGRGIGLQLWTHALAHAGARTVGLDGVAEQQENYAASGFAHAGGTTRFSGRITAAHSAQTRPVRPEDVAGLVVAEATASGTYKPAYLTEWFRERLTRKTVVLDREGELSGFCTLRQCREGAKIGPLVARSEVDAETLIRHAAGVFPGDIVIDVPDASPGLAQLCARLSLTPGFRTARMYRGNFEPGTSTFFAVTTLELG